MYIPNSSLLNFFLLKIKNKFLIKKKEILQYFSKLFNFFFIKLILCKINKFFIICALTLLGIFFWANLFIFVSSSNINLILSFIFLSFFICNNLVQLWTYLYYCWFSSLKILDFIAPPPKPADPARAARRAPGRRF